MYYSIIKGDILKSKLVTLITVLFVAAASMLVSLAAVLIINLSGSIETLMMQAKTPHFMQMHAGEIDTPRLMAFAKQNGNVNEFQVLEFLNVDAGEIVIGQSSLAGSVQDNGMSTQSDKFDFLLDLNGNIINASEGELYVPICYMKDGTAKIGDKAFIYGKAFIVKGFLRDSQMNSTLSSSKRFVVSKKDYEEIKNLGNVEYLIEFRLKDLSTLGAFENAYTLAGLEANGPTLTYPLFKMINAISDGMMIAVIILVSALVITIALLCIRFTLLAKIEEDYREIGVMKAIGLRILDIKKIYLAKYAAVAGLGGALGFVLSLIFRGILLENIRLYYGESPRSALALYWGIIGVLLVCFTIIIYVSSVLRRFRKISAADAIRFGISPDRFRRTNHFCLSTNRLLDTHVFLGLKDVLTRKKLYATMLVILILSTFIILVPQNLYSTISSKHFVKYMGIGDCAIRIDIQQTDDILGKTETISKTLKNDPAVSKYAVLITKRFKTNRDDGVEESIKVELGDHSLFPIDYSQGRAPITQNEISLSALNAKALGKKPNDVIALISDGKEMNFTVSGIYSDITNGGKTAKAIFKDHSSDIMWSVISVELSDSSLLGSKIMAYKDSFHFAKVSDINAYILQTFGNVIGSIKIASYAGMAVSLIITLLVTLLFMKMLIVKDRYAVAVLKALGFTNRNIAAQYVSRSVCIMIISIVLGTFLANTLGELLAGAVIASFGASSFKFTVRPLSTYLLYPLMIAGSVLIATLIAASDIEKIKISENIKE